MRSVYKALSIPVFLLAVVLLIYHWLVSPDINIYKIGGGGIFDIGLANSIVMPLRWFIIAVTAALGYWLWTLGDKRKPRDGN